MSGIVQGNNKRRTIQRYTFAGIIVLLGGLLYWLLNYGVPNPLLPTKSNSKQTSDFIVTDKAVIQLRDYLLNKNLEQPVLIESITFADQSATIEATSDRQIIEIASLMQQYPESKILIRGHSANEGSPDESKQLSLKRANTMGEQLVAAGGMVNNIIIMGMGSTEPLAANTTRRGRAKNRRVDIAITQ